MSLGNELREMKKLITDMQMSGSEKDSEIFKLNLHLAEEKRKMMELNLNNSIKSVRRTPPSRESSANSRITVAKNLKIEAINS